MSAVLRVGGTSERIVLTSHAIDRWGERGSPWLGPGRLDDSGRSRTVRRCWLFGEGRPALDGHHECRCVSGNRRRHRSTSAPEAQRGMDRCHDDDQVGRWQRLRRNSTHLQATFSRTPAATRRHAPS